MKMIELARQGRHGDWEHIGDYASIESALNAAEGWARNDDTYRDDFGTAVFGLTEDTRGGHYEMRVEVYEDGTSRVVEF